MSGGGTTREGRAAAVTTIRDRVREIQLMLRDDLATPAIMRESEVRLSALYGNCLQEQTIAELAYKPVLLVCMEADGPANRARIKAECSDQYARWLEAKQTAEQVHQMLVTLRNVGRSLNEEMRLAR